MSPKHFGHARYKRRSEARRKWSLNAVRARARHRVERALAPLRDGPPFLDKPGRAEWFRITVEHSDGSKHALTSHRTPWGWSISPTLMGRKIAVAMTHYHPISRPHATH